MSAEKKRILIVDDEPSITRVLKLNLEQTGHYEVQAENDSRAAAGVAGEFHPDLILMDVMMPGVDGGHLANTLQATPGLKDVPIVFLTAAVTREEVRARRGLVGGLPFLAKPVNLQEVLAYIEQYLGRPVACGAEGAMLTA